jgi:uncharacterized protein YjbJ (UPF0337 family)
MTDLKTKGRGDEVTGRVKEAFGDLTGDQESKDKGQAQQNRGNLKKAAGTVQDKFEDAKDKVDS